MLLPTQTIIPKANHYGSSCPKRFASTSIPYRAPSQSEQYDAFPDELRVRDAKVAHQVLVTTMFDHHKVTKDDLSEHYAWRWNVELDLRNLMSTTGMDMLSCQTWQMHEKQLCVHPLAYNGVRSIMA